MRFRLGIYCILPFLFLNIITESISAAKSTRSASKKKTTKKGQKKESKRSALRPCPYSSECQCSEMSLGGLRFNIPSQWTTVFENTKGYSLIEASQKNRNKKDRKIVQMILTRCQKCPFSLDKVIDFREGPYDGFNARQQDTFTMTLGRSPSAVTLIVRKKTYSNPIDDKRWKKVFYLQLADDIYIISITVLRIDKLSRCENIYIDQFLDGLSPGNDSVPKK